MDFALFDVIIIGGWPAGVAAAVYCARKKLKIFLIAELFGGQSIVSADIENWIGETHISGIELSKKLEAHVRAYPEVIEIKSPEKVVNVKSIVCTETAAGGRMCDFEVTSDKATYRGKTVIIASGARRRKLGIPGEEQFSGKGVAFCSTCDAPLFRDKKVVVVGGGNTGLEGVIDLFPYASEVYLMDGGPALKGDPATVDEVKKNSKLKSNYMIVLFRITDKII